MTTASRAPVWLRPQPGDPKLTVVLCCRTLQPGSVSVPPRPSWVLGEARTLNAQPADRPRDCQNAAQTLRVHHRGRTAIPQEQNSWVDDHHLILLLRSNPIRLLECTELIEDGHLVNQELVQPKQPRSASSRPHLWFDWICPSECPPLFEPDQ